MAGLGARTHFEHLTDAERARIVLQNRVLAKLFPRHTRVANMREFLDYNELILRLTDAALLKLKAMPAAEIRRLIPHTRIAGLDSARPSAEQFSSVKSCPYGDFGPMWANVLDSDRFWQAVQDYRTSNRIGDVISAEILAHGAA